MFKGEFIRSICLLVAAILVLFMVVDLDVDKERAERIATEQRLEKLIIIAAQKPQPIVMRPRIILYSTQGLPGLQKIDSDDDSMGAPGGFEPIEKVEGP